MRVFTKANVCANLLVFVLVSPFACSQVSPNMGDVIIETYYADLNEDSIEEKVTLEKTVKLPLITDYPVPREFYDYDVVIRILDGKTGGSLYESQTFEENGIGVLVTKGKLAVLKKETGTTQIEYTETFGNSEGPELWTATIKKHLFSWNGSQIVVQVTTEDFPPDEED